MALLTGLSPSALAVGERLTAAGSGLTGDVRFELRGASTASLVATLDGGDQAWITMPDVMGGGAGVVTVWLTVDGVRTASASVVITATPAVASARWLTSLAAVKSAMRLGPADVVDDARLGAILTAASAAIAAEARRTFGAQPSATEVYDGDGGPTLRLRRSPVGAVTALSIGGQSRTLTDLKVYPAYIAFESGGDYEPRLRTDGSVFPRGRRNVSVTYTAGFAEVPAEVQAACISEVLYRHNLIDKQGVVSEGNTQAGVQSAYSQQVHSPEAQRVVNRYARAEVDVI